jgi:hypothetical protein
MYIFDSVIPAGKSSEVPLCTSLEVDSTAVEVSKARRKRRFNRRVSPEQSFGAHDRSFLPRDGRHTRITKLQGRPCHTFKSRFDRLETYCHRRDSTILKQMPFSPVCLGSVRRNAAPQKLGPAAATTPKTMFNSAASLLRIGETNSGSLFGHIQPLPSRPGVEASSASFFEATDPLNSLYKCLSPSISDETKAFPRVIDLEPASTMLITGSSKECTIHDFNFHSDLSSTSESGLSIDGEGRPFPDEESKTVESVNSNSLLGCEHESKFVNNEGTSAKTKLIKGIMEEFWTIFFDREVQSLAASTETASTETASTKTASSSVISESNRSGYSSTTITSQGSKRSRADQSGHEADEEQDNDENRSKKPKMVSIPGTEEGYCNFACPFRKHNPHKYSIQHWRTCALTPLRTVARVK